MVNSYTYGIYPINGLGYMVFLVSNPFVRKSYIIDNQTKVIQLVNVGKKDVETELERIARGIPTLRKFEVRQTSRFDR